MNFEFTKAEAYADAASKLAPFTVQIHDIRRTVSSILELFGRNNIFSEYTVHNYSHVQSMLEDLEWIIPDQTRTSLTPADWLMIVLALYFHDLGLVVTEDEFRNRDLSAFSDFCENVLFAGDDGKDYKAKIKSLGSEAAERLFYQEFVRKNHAARIKSWIEGIPTLELGAAHAQIKEIDELLKRLDPDFRSDLALICESHNLDDLKDDRKYKSFKPYGSSPSEVANLVYCAVVLRTVDLLQITRQRAPSILYRFINPTDPISQVEWVKQNAVKGVFPKPATDQNGVVMEGETDTVAVYAKFTDEDGFFGLTSYLAYARAQLQASYTVVAKANEKLQRKYRFPWRQIDDTTVEAVGFIPTPFKFSIDQSKILDLLTGHTLYNDSAVALRELVQNSLDAVRLQCLIDETDSQQAGSVKIDWNSAANSLKITDNGTGMTQDIVERHLLNVGSSRYQDENFRKDHTKFNSISRFGIGVLSAFMVADDVQITTVSRDEEQARRVSLRSVHGKYLIKLFEKGKEPICQEIGDHGTSITLQIRGSSKRIDVLQTMRQWILFPRCRVSVTIDGSSPMQIGFQTVEEALRRYIDESTYLNSEASRCKVHTAKTQNFEVAFATRYSRHFRDRSFVTVSEQMLRDRRHLPPIGVCVEGIRVEFGSPGFSSNGILAVVNCTGRKAPRTNVSRSALENATERTALIKELFDAYYIQVQDEIDRLQKEEGYSFVYATTQFPYIAGAIFNSTSEQYARIDALKRFPLFVVEDQEKRTAMSAEQLRTVGGFWTVESNTTKALSSLLRDTDSSVTSRQVVEFCAFKGSELPDGILILNSEFGSAARNIILSDFSVIELRGSITDRRLDTKWAPSNSAPLWLHSENIRDRFALSTNVEVRHFHRMLKQRTHRRPAECAVPLQDFPVVGLERHFAVVCLERVFILPGTPLSSYLADLGSKEDWQSAFIYQILTDAISPISDRGRYVRSVSPRAINQNLKDTLARLELDFDVDLEEFNECIVEMKDRLELFDPFSWYRNESNDEDEDDYIPF